MRRPLAVFGCSFLLCMLAGLVLPAAALLPVALGSVAAAMVLFFLFRKKAAVPVLLLAAAALALALRAGYDFVTVRPVAGLAGTESTVRARVTDVQPGYGPETVHATVKILSLDGAECSSFTVQLRGIEEAFIGEIISLKVRFSGFGQTGLRNYNYAKGIYVGASARSAPVKVGYAPNFVCRMRLFQYAAGDSIREKLPQELSTVIAAMTVGDKRFLPYETADNFKMAGLSHMLVVSGLHLAVVSGVAYVVFKKLFRRKRLVSLLGIFTIFLFMAFTGFTPSIVRSGLVHILLHLAPLLSRKADIYTSMGLAALVLCLQNPYAAADVGLLLSFSSTLGVLAGGAIAGKIRQKVLPVSMARPRKAVQNESIRDASSAAGEEEAFRRGYDGPQAAWPKRAGMALLSAAVPTLCVSVAILPVLSAAGSGFSLLTLPMNLIAVPLLTPIVLAGFIMIIPAGLPVLGIVTGPAALAGGFLASVLDKITGFCGGLSGVWVPLSGLFCMTVIMAVYAMVFLAYSQRKKARVAISYLLCAALMVPLAVLLHTGFSANNVQVVVAGGSASPSVVVIREHKAAVLYRGYNSDAAIKRVFREYNIRECVLFVDMRRTVSGTGYEQAFTPSKTLIMQEDMVNNAVITPFRDVGIYLKKQGGGNLACVDVGGYKVGLAAGAVNLAPYAQLDMLVAGSSAAQGGYKALLVSGGMPGWADENAEIIRNGGTATIVIRPGRGLVYREVQDGIGMG